MLGSKTLVAAKQLIDEIARNNYQWNSRGKLVIKPARMIEVSEVSVLAAEVEVLSRKIDNVSSQKSAIVMTCDTCGRGHAR